MPLQVAMKRTVQIVVPLTLILAIPLAGYGLTKVAGSVLLSGGGLTMALMMTLALMGARGAAHVSRAVAPAVAAAAPARPKAVVVEVATADLRPPELEEVAAFFVKAAAKQAPPAADGFAADELAFFAEGESQAMRASDSSPHWQLS
jgi:hypothetical protein